MRSLKQLSSSFQGRREKSTISVDQLPAFHLRPSSNIDYKVDYLRTIPVCTGDSRLVYHMCFACFPVQVLSV